MRKMASIWGSKKSGVVIVFEDGETRSLTWKEWVELANSSCGGRKRRR